jgi:hypothetical protein
VADGCRAAAHWFSEVARGAKKKIKRHYAGKLVCTREQTRMKYYTAAQARQFAEKWLPAWSGNNPELLASFYAEDAFYLDPGIPGGVKGKANLLTYFRNLLANNPEWVWSQIEGIPLEDGFLNKWLAKIPVGSVTLEIVGVCLVQVDNAGKIRRNEVYFDRTKLLAEIARLKQDALKK